jgi:hypothetical protein
MEAAEVLQHIDASLEAQNEKITEFNRITKCAQG